VPIPASTNDKGHFATVLRDLVKTYKRSKLFRLVSADAGNCSEANARVVTGELNLDYLFRLKADQPTLLAEAKRLLAGRRARQAVAETVDVVGSTTETRRLHITSEMAGFLAWEHLRTTIRIRKEKHDLETGKLLEKEDHCAISSQTLWEGAPALFGQGLEAFGISAQDRISPVADMDLARVYGAAARVLGNRHTGLYMGWEGDAEKVRIACHAPPVIICGPDVEQRTLGELRFLLGRALELTRPEYIIVSGLARGEFSQLFAAVLRAFHPRHSRRRSDDSDPHARRAAQLKKDLPYRVSRKLVDLFGAKAHVEFNSALWRQAVQHSGNRAGLLVSGDLRAACRAILDEELDLEGEAKTEWSAEDFAGYLDRSDQLRELCAFAVSEEYFQARQALGVTAQSTEDETLP